MGIVVPILLYNFVTHAHYNNTLPDTSQQSNVADFINPLPLKVYSGVLMDKYIRRTAIPKLISVDSSLYRAISVRI